MLEAWWFLFGFYLALRWLSYDRLKTWVSLNSPENTDRAKVLDIAQSLHKLVYLASRLHLLPMTCLPRAFTLRWMLSRRGIPAQLRIGIKKTPDGIYAHAWVEVEEGAIGEANDITKRFKIIDSMEYEHPIILGDTR
jgi:hypothetical protein